MAPSDLSTKRKTQGDALLIRLTRGFLDKALLVELRLLVARTLQDIEVARHQAQIRALVALGICVVFHARIGVDVEE
ncbi:hypothetical protein J1614_005018 [Plenodomus biglobosus]|nr:hypothetical protein J1614_005018 [Plenodomus biglobosus]